MRKHLKRLGLFSLFVTGCGGVDTSSVDNQTQSSTKTVRAVTVGTKGFKGIDPRMFKLTNKKRQ